MAFHFSHKIRILDVGDHITMNARGFYFFNKENACVIVEQLCALLKAERIIKLF